MNSTAKLVLGAAAAGLLVLASTCGSSSPATQLDGRWMTDIDLATARATAEQKPMLVAFRCEA